MPGLPEAQLCHVGLYTFDLEKMVDFYTRIFGLVVTDRGVSGRGYHIAFLSLQRYDVILEINREPVHNITDFRRIEAKLKSGDDVMFLFWRAQDKWQGTTTYVGTTLP